VLHCSCLKRRIGHCPPEAGFRTRNQNKQQQQQQQATTTSKGKFGFSDLAAGRRRAFA
jgi:hypothetical protein